MTRASTSAATVVVLCAAWCGTCREFRLVFDRLRASRPEARFFWLDVEDDAALVGDIDVENFPTLAVFRGEMPVFFGASLPQEGVVARLMGALMDGEPVPAAVPEAVASLPRVLGLTTSGA
ncbi:MAG TPA: thioredoxin family protein [Burkholderiales bacterium]|nr:thioredoxin family protein [Burkholderiales bacterium]